MKTRRGVAAIIFVKEKGGKKYLLLKRILNWHGWEWLKGGRKENESEIACLKREIKEETGKDDGGYDIQSTSLLHEFDYEKEFVKDRKRWDSASNKIYLVRFKNKIVRLNKKEKEHSDFKWVGKKEALKMISWNDQKRIFEKIA